MNQLIGVGVLGANPDRGWAARAHIPAINASPDFTLAAVATTRADSSVAARDRFGARHAFTDAAALAQHPDVDLVVVTVKVPTHVELVTTALAAGKHVYCEWPLTRTAAEAAALAAAADRAGVHTVVGLQARFSPAAATARALIADGHIGTVQSATLYSSRSKGNTLDVPAWTAYTYDANNHAGLVDVLGGHALDLIQYLLGPIRDGSAYTAIRSPRHRIVETGEPITVTAADHFLAVTELVGGALVSVHLHDGEPTRPRTRLEIAGTSGNLALVSSAETDPWAAQLQIDPLRLLESRPNEPIWMPVALDVDNTAALPTQATNVARLYDQLAKDLRDDTTSETPDFGTGRALHSLIETITHRRPHASTRSN
jgi:predicted dehydrogenase